MVGMQTPNPTPDGNAQDVLASLLGRMRRPAPGQGPGQTEQPGRPVRFERSGSEQPDPPNSWSLLLTAAGLAGLTVGALAFVLLGDGSIQQAPAVQPAAQIEALSLIPPGEGRQAVSGLLQFRGNPSRNWYGLGPMPRRPRILWRYPKQPMCSESRVGDRVSTWCGTGWTGQPVIWERPDGVTEVIVGAYDRQVHFLDADTGRPTRPSFTTGDLIKGSVTLDPNGDPLLYFGSRDNKLRVVALDRPRPTQLWALTASFVPGIWNNDWDGNPTVRDGILYAGGENGYFFAVRLNRDYDAAGRIRVRPEMLVALRGWTDELLAAVGDQNASIENSVTLFEDRAYFANSAGRVVGLDISRIEQGWAPVVFDFWAGDDVDASIVADAEGMLYVSVELERFLPRSDAVGQLIKLNPYRPADPVIWSLAMPPSFADYKGGIWATPALGAGVLYVATNAGQLLAVDAASGQITFADDLGPHAWSSPVVIDDSLLVATCRGELRVYDLSDPWRPARDWSLRIPTHGCIESTPAVWKGRIIVGARDGYVYAIGDGPAAGEQAAASPVGQVPNR
jgi:outer membrane protein assembly factor BamB